MTSSFVRVGAVATCRNCNHQFSIKSEHVQRVATPPAASSSEAVPVPEPIPGEEGPPTGGGLSQGSGPAGLAVESNKPGEMPAGSAAPGGAGAGSPASLMGTTVAGAGQSADPGLVPGQSADTTQSGPAARNINPLIWVAVAVILAAAAWGLWYVAQHTGRPSSPPKTTPATRSSQTAPNPMPRAEQAITTQAAPTAGSDGAYVLSPPPTTGPSSQQGRTSHVCGDPKVRRSRQPS